MIVFLRFRLAVPVVVALVLLIVGAGRLSAEVVTYPAPEGETLSAEYEVLADGESVDVYTARTLDAPFAGKHWDYGGPYSFANFDMTGQVTVQIKSKRSLRGTVIRPVFVRYRCRVRRRPHPDDSSRSSAEAKHRARRSQGSAPPGSPTRWKRIAPRRTPRALSITARAFTSRARSRSAPAKRSTWPAERW